MNDDDDDDDEACECCGAVGVECLMGSDENGDTSWMCEHCLRNTGQWEQAVEGSAQVARYHLERDVSPRCTNAKPESELDVLLMPTVSLTHEEDGAP